MVKNATLQKAYEEADCVIGPISCNATQIDTGNRQARASDFQQWAFKYQDLTTSIFGDIINNGTVHVFRVVHDCDAALPPCGWCSRTR
jgi:hypothetical protein